MAYHLSEASLRCAVRHLCRYGDTDIFPHLVEIAFFDDEEDAVVAEIRKLDLDSFTPSGSIEALAPKSRFAFRIAHQLPALDTLLLTGCVVEIGAKIEAKRKNTLRAYSYRFKPDAKTGQIFRQDRTYKDWLHRQMGILSEDKSYRRIVSTDISDFYARINFHRLENLLDEAAPNHGAARFIKKHIRVIRAKQSFGLPVGGTAARLLAELALSDTDQALSDQGLRSTRFVDDFRIFLKADDPYDALGFLAEQLGINEGLSLNAAKTAVTPRRLYAQRLERLTTDVADEAEGVALDALTSSLYFDKEPDQDDLESLKGLNIVGMLETEIEKDVWDVGRIRVLFRALRIAKPVEAIAFINDNFSDLTIFAKELCLLMEVLSDDDPGCFDSIRNVVIKGVKTPPASSVQLIRTWLLEIFVRGIISVNTLQLKSLEGLSAIPDKRQLLLMKGRNGDAGYFRKQKTAVHSFSDWELNCLVWGASCLPKDEYDKWIDTIKPHFSKPLSGLFLKWAVKNKKSLVEKLKGTTIEHADADE